MKNEKLKKIVSSKTFKTISLSIVLGLALTGSFIAGFENARGLPATYKYYSSNKTLATVGDTKIKVNELKTQMEMLFTTEPQRVFSKEEIAEKEQMFIDYTVTREALKQKALKEKLTVEDEIVDSQFNDLISNLEGMLKLDKESIFKKFGLNENYVKDKIKDELLGNAYLDKVSDIGDKEATKYFEENTEEFIKVEASHILIKTIDDNYNPLPEDEIKEAKKTAEKVLKKALDGEDFAELAKKYSQDGSAQDGGNLGYFGRGEMVPAFEESAFNLKVGEISPELVETEYGYHIIKKTGEKESTLEDALPSIKDSLAYEKKYNIMKEILDSPDVNIVYEP